jgi:hypothetical protein
MSRALNARSRHRAQRLVSTTARGLLRQLDDLQRHGLLRAAEPCRQRDRHSETHQRRQAMADG